MRKAWIWFITTTLCLTLLTRAGEALTAPPALSAASAILLDWQTGQLLFEKEAHLRREPASTTKVLTALIALERANLTDEITVSRRAAQTPGSSMHIKEGEVYSLRDLLHGLLLESGNDAAVAIAEHVSGSVEAFAVLMNARALEIGAKESHFTNPHGLTDAEHYSTAYDLALITRQALRNPRFAAIVALRESPLLATHSKGKTMLHNTNSLLSMMPDADGVKTGTTNSAGACLIASATREGHKLVAVVLKAPGRWSDSARLLEWGFQNFRLARFGEKGEVVFSHTVVDGSESIVPLVLAEDLAVLLAQPEGVLPSLSLQVAKKVEAPVLPGQVVGKAIVRTGNRVLASVPVVAGKAVPHRTIWQAISQEMGRLLRWALDRDVLP